MRKLLFTTMVMAALVLGVSGSLGASAEDAAPSPTSTANISVVSTPDANQPTCTTAANLDATGALYTGDSAFVYTIRAKAPICEPVTAVIYNMPNNIFWPWPQQKAEAVTFQVPAGTTVVTFTKGCIPQQFDLVTGDTPERIQPTTGPMHGPLLFLNPYSAIQHFPTNPCSATTTTTTPGATTTTEVAPSTTLNTTTTTAVVEGATTTVVPTTEATTTTLAVVPTSVADITTVPTSVLPKVTDRTPSGQSGESLPRTGTDTGRLLFIAAGCIVLGVAATRLARMRSRA